MLAEEIQKIRDESEQATRVSILGEQIQKLHDVITMNESYLEAMKKNKISNPGWAPDQLRDQLAPK